MPYSRPGYMFYATATKAVDHGKACTELGIVGVAVKQKAVPWSQGITGQATISIGEKFAMITKGVVQIPFVTGCVKGDVVYIAAADNVVSETNTGLALGTVVEVAGERGTPTGFMRVDLDKKVDKT